MAHDWPELSECESSRSVDLLQTPELPLRPKHTKNVGEMNIANGKTTWSENRKTKGTCLLTFNDEQDVWISFDVQSLSCSQHEPEQDA